MARALQLARNGLYSCHPNPRVGCVLVKEGQIIGEGWHAVAGAAHAEVNALQNATVDPAGADCYVTLEPCCHSGKTPPCTDALIKAGIRRVIAAMPDPNPKVSGQGLQQLAAAGITAETGLMQEQAIELNRGYIARRTRGMPFVTCKLGMSLDGRTAMANGESKWITGPQARTDVQHLRAQSSAIMTGIGTIITDNPALVVRDMELDCQPLRAVIDPQLRFRATAKILDQPGRTLIFTHNTEDVMHRENLEEAGAEVIVMEEGSDSLPRQALAYLADKEECNEVLLESGAKLAGSMLVKGLIDEIIIYMAPVLLGDDARGLFNLPGMRSIEEKINLVITEIRMVGKDARITLKPQG